MIKVEPLTDSNIDFSSVDQYTSFDEWVGGSVTRAFYLGFLKDEFDARMAEIGDTENSYQLLKSIVSAGNRTKKYLKELSELLQPYLESSEGFIVLDMVNNALNEIKVENKNDIYGIAYSLGVYVHYLYSLQAQE